MGHRTVPCPTWRKSVKKIHYRPSKTHSALGLIVGIVFIGIGLFVVIPTFGLFGILWTFLAVFVTVVNGMNTFSKKGVPTGSIIIEDDEESKSESPLNDTGNHDTYVRNKINFNPIKEDIEKQFSANQDTGREDRDPEQRLAELYRLYNRHLITEEEYKQKRAEILKDI